MGLTNFQMNKLSELDMRVLDMRLHAWAKCLENSNHHSCENCENRKDCQEPAKLKDLLELADILDGVIEVIQTLR